MNVNSGTKGQQFRNSFGPSFLIEPLLKSSPNDKMLTSFKRGAIFLLKINLQISKPMLCDFFKKSLQFEKAVPQLHIFHMDIHPLTHVKLKLLKVDVQNMLRLSVIKNFQIKWEPFAQPNWVSSKLVSKGSKANSSRLDYGHMGHQ